MPKTSDGIYFVSATEQEGSMSGEHMGRIWIQDTRIKGACCWTFYKMREPGIANAAKLEKAAPRLTEDEFDSLLADYATL